MQLWQARTALAQMDAALAEVLPAGAGLEPVIDSRNGSLAPMAAAMASPEPAPA